MSFFKMGNEGRKLATQRENESKAKAEQRKNMPREFWMNKGTTVKVLFLDDPEFFVGRHSIKIKGQFEKVTCIDDSGVMCPGCTSGKIPTIYVAATIITLDPIKSKDGQKTYIYQRQLLCVGGDAQKFLFNLYDREKKKNPKFTLKGCIVELGRGTSENAPAVGQFSLEGRASEKLIQEIKAKIVKAKINGDIPITDYFKPYDYVKAFQPLAVEDLKKIFGVDDAYGENNDDLSYTSDGMIEDTDSGVIDGLEGGSDDDDPFKEPDTGAEHTPEEEKTNAYENMSDKELMNLLLESGVALKAAKAMSREDRILYLMETSEDTDSAGDSESLEAMSLEDLKALAVDKGMSAKAAAKMSKEDLIEAINDLSEGE